MRVIFDTERRILAYGSHIDIAAGAQDIPTLNSTVFGTSYAAPQVAGVAALMLMVNPDLTPSELKTKLRDSADIIEAFDGRDAAGSVDATEKNLADGRRLNAYRAVKLALGEATTQLDPLPAIIANTDPFTASAPLVLRERGLSEVGGWEIAHNEPVEVRVMGANGDQVSSLIIGAGCTVEVFRHPDFRGARLTYVGPQGVDLSGSTLDNQISSYKFYCTPASARADEPLVFRERGLRKVDGWEITHNEPVEVRSMGVDGDQVSSLFIDAGYTVEVFRHPDFRGTQQTYVGPQYVDLSGSTLDNQISSYKFYRTPVSARADERLVLRERGLSKPAGWQIGHNAPVEVRSMGGNGDQVSSLRVGAGYTVEVFRHPDFRGARLTYAGPQQVDLTGSTLDNQISSYKLYHSTWPADERLVLRERGLSETGGWEIGHNAPVEVRAMGVDGDKVSSLRIGAGYSVEVFRHPDFRGTRRAYVGPQRADLSGTTLDNQISSYKVYRTAAAGAEALVLRERGLNEAGGWQIGHQAPVAVRVMGVDGDKVSSLRIGADYTVEVFRHPDFQGTQQTYVGPQQVDLTGNTLDNQISSYKFYVTP